MKDDLIRKLNLKKYEKIALYNEDIHSQVLKKLVTEEKLVDLDYKYDVIFIHVYSIDDMKDSLLKLWQHESLNQEGLAFLVYPKLNNPYYPGIHRDDIFPGLGVKDALGLVPGTHYKFNKMVSLNQVFTIIGIKHLNEKELQKTLNIESSTKTSGRVGDYVQFIPQLQSKLEKINLTYLKTFNHLSPGKQREWAREIYSAKTQGTIEKRFQKLINELNEKQ